MSVSENVRIDKWLWAVRIYKSRSQATEACRKGRVFIDGEAVKPSRGVKINDHIIVRKMPVIHTYKVTGLIEKRVSPQLALNNYEELTPEEELNKINQNHSFFGRDKGLGRPTKKERRMIDKLLNS